MPDVKNFFPDKFDDDNKPIADLKRKNSKRELGRKTSGGGPAPSATSNRSKKSKKGKGGDMFGEFDDSQDVHVADHVNPTDIN